jgi:hypothetical protein
MSGLTSKIELVITFRKEYSISFPDTLNSLLNHEWQEQLLKAKERNSILFNGPLFHVNKWAKKEKRIELQLGLTDYKSYVCTRSKEFSTRFPDIPQSMPIAVCAALITTDGKFIIERRKGVDIYNDFFHVVGGFIDPDQDMDYNGIPDPFKAIVREVKEETGIDIDFNNLILLGLAEDLRVPHYELCFLLETGLSSLEVQNNFNKMKTDREFNFPIFIDFSQEHIDSFLEKNKERLSPTGRDCLIMAINFNSQK